MSGISLRKLYEEKIADLNEQIRQKDIEDTDCVRQYREADKLLEEMQQKCNKKQLEILSKDKKVLINDAVVNSVKWLIIGDDEHPPYNTDIVGFDEHGPYLTFNVNKKDGSITYEQNVISSRMRYLLSDMIDEQKMSMYSIMERNKQLEDVYHEKEEYRRKHDITMAAISQRQSAIQSEKRMLVKELLNTNRILEDIFIYKKEEYAVWRGTEE